MNKLGKLIKDNVMIEGKKGAVYLKNTKRMYHYNFKIDGDCWVSQPRVYWKENELYFYGDIEVNGIECKTETELLKVLGVNHE